ncbi:MAG: DNA primase [Verrucomicrobiota bacterium]|nr:DNA primase [Verrucomicrobiota bacterium]
MPIFSKESLEALRSRVDLVEVVSPYLKLQRSGKNHKALCPFHEERSPSFMIQAGETHYHCFGCGAHGDAIQFLMLHLKMSFVEAVEWLAQRFHIELETEKGEGSRSGPSKKELKEALERAVEFYHFSLLHTKEGQAALDYLYHRGLDLDFIRTFSFGLAPKQGYLQKILQEQGIHSEILEAAGLLSKGREMFADRITIPIRDAMGAPIGFSSRKYKEETFGGKYINTPETPLFKKSKVLFGLSWSRALIAKERKALIVEGQIDALRLIHSGFPWTVAGQGTAFGEEMVKELLHLGVREVFLALDGDTAGQEASAKIGDLFQKEGVEVFALTLPEGWDPDLFLQKKGPAKWQELLDERIDYLSFLVAHRSRSLSLQSPASKTKLVETIAQQIKAWENPIMVHESLKKLARLTQTPESLLGNSDAPIAAPIQRFAHATLPSIATDRILEADLLRWLFLLGLQEGKLIELAEKNLSSHHFRTAVGKSLYESYLKQIKETGSCDLLSLVIDQKEAEAQFFLSEILQKKVNRERALPCFIETIQKLLERHWMGKREEIRQKIYSGAHTEEEVLLLAREFDRLKKERPEVKEHTQKS